MNFTLLAQVGQLPSGAVKAPGGDSVLHGLDTLAGAGTRLRDTLSTAPLPGGVSALVRFLFQVPQWIQIGGVVLAAIVGLIAVIFLWRRRVLLWTWLTTRSSTLLILMGCAAVAVLSVALFSGMKSWNYMQHDNGFCTGCHIMERPFQRFAAGAGKHEDLKCHDCHQQTIFASMRQLVLWVEDRPQKIGEHALVPNARCESCHQVPGGKKPYQHALFLAGHKVHLESDSSALKDISCAKCHGAEIHRFIPSAGACQQSGCHANQRIHLAKMSRLPEIKCTTCHAFTADIPGLASQDSAKHALIPAQQQCLSCHGMKGKPSGYILAKDPHKGACGFCHDVHKDSLPIDARARCVTCHKSLVSSAFHNGANHKRVQTQCLLCHQPHAASLDPSDCVTCHTAIQKRGLFHPPLPFDTNAVIRKQIGGRDTVSVPEDRNELTAHGPYQDDTVPEQPPPRDSVQLPVKPSADSFPHSRHTSLPCLTCHVVNDTRRLVFQAPRGCDLCHHQSLLAGTVVPADCARCHAAAKRAAPSPTTVLVSLPNRPPVPRTIGFRHEIHQQTCGTCHQPPNTVPPDSIRTCQACHAQHHTADRTCATCHNRVETPAAHSRTTHFGCNACHTTGRIAALTPNRNFCLTCHVKQLAHQPGRECTTCHFLETPEQFRPRLMVASTR